MCSARDNAALPTLGFPIRASAGHWLFSASPRLIAAVHALHRLLVPRHPPCALNILTVIGEKPWRTFPLEKSCDFSGVSPDSSHSEKSARISPQVNAARRLPDTRYIGYCAVFKVREEAQLTHRSSGVTPRAPAVSRSLKTQQHASNRLAPIGLGEICQ